MIAATCPRSSPNALVAFFLTALVTELLLFSRDAAHYVAIAAILGNIIVALCMPCRDPFMPRDGISRVGQAPNSKWRSPEDNITLGQFLTVSWLAPLLSLGRQRQLNEEDVWFLGHEFQHGRLHARFRRLKGSVLGRVLKANAVDVLIVFSIATVEILCGSNFPLKKYIIIGGTGWLTSCCFSRQDFSIPVLLQQLLQAVEDPVVPKKVALIYASLSLALRLLPTQLQVLNLWYGRRCYERSRGEMIMMIYEKTLSRKNVFGGESSGNTVKNNADKQEEETTKEAASMGKIFNLLRGDAYEVSQRFWEVDELIDKPVGMIVATVLVWKLFGPSCFLAIVTVLVAQSLNAIVTRILLRRERVRRVATDARLQATSQFVEALRHLRWYGWEGHWLGQVMEARNRELILRIVTNLWTILIRFINTFASGIFPVVALYSYTLLAGHELRIDIIFPALQLFNMWESRLIELPNLITALINASIAVGRIEDFMAEPNKDQIAVQSSATDDYPFRLESCTFAWPGEKSPVLSNVDISVSTGLTILHGKVGAGKTALLQAFLGELDLLGGNTCHISHEMIGYCAQSPWLQSMSIRENILFSSPFDEQRYRRVLDACALVPDLANFKHGDLSFMGENGVGLSGGQRARVALARAMYSRARILLLDDPLSALDHNTAEMVVRKCFTGPLAQGRVIVLATHRIALVRSMAKQVVQIHDGIVTPSSSVDAVRQEDEEDLVEHDDTALEEEEAAAVPDKFIEEEHRAAFGVKARVYWAYIRAGKLKWWTVLVVILTIYRLTSVGQSWFLKEWGEAYGDVRRIFSLGAFGFRRQEVHLLPLGPDWSRLPRHFISRLPPPLVDVRPWLWVFFAIAAFQAIALLIAQLFMLVIIYCAGKSMFEEVMLHVSRATFRFLDVTPIGRLMNRLTSDIGVVDGNISEQFQAIAFQAITWVSSVLVIATVTPGFLIFSLVVCVAYVVVFLHFLPTSQSLRRLEMVSLSPLISNFGELLHGLTTVRAFHAETRFQERVIAVVDKFQGMDHFYWSLQSWLIYRFEVLSALSTFSLTVLALYTDISPGLIAFVLIAANNFVLSTHALCRQYGRLQMDFVSVERVDELRHIEKEALGSIDPPASWPRYGQDIIFEDVTIRYAPHLDPSLVHISLRIPGGSTTAVIGRTGSGKSTLAISLLGVARPEADGGGGAIWVDNIDIARVNTHALRSRVTFVAQDPVLFPGSIRHNLDPMREYSDKQCSGVLERVCSRHHWTLDKQVEAGGRNLSQGERQLIGLTRAVLRASPVVILDEATASVDVETSLEIQQIIREELRESTVITIAHRLEAIKNAEYYIVLEGGKVKDQGYVENRKHV